MDGRGGTWVLSACMDSIYDGWMAVRYYFTCVLSRTWRRVGQHLLHALEKRRLIDSKNVIHLPRMTRRKLFRPQMRPRQIRRIKRRVHVHIRLHLLRHQIRKRHDSRSGLIPQRQRDVVIQHQLRIRIITSCDAIQHALRQILLVRYVACDGDGWEGCRDGNVGGFGVDEEVDVGANVLG